MYEILSTMSVLMAPITPFFSEYTYQHLRDCHPNRDNNDVAEDAIGRAKSVHMLMMPDVDESRCVWRTRCSDYCWLRPLGVGSVFGVGGLWYWQQPSFCVAAVGFFIFVVPFSYTSRGMWVVKLGALGKGRTVT